MRTLRTLTSVNSLKHTLHVVVLNRVVISLVSDIRHTWTGGTWSLNISSRFGNITPENKDEMFVILAQF